MSIYNDFLMLIFIIKYKYYLKNITKNKRNDNYELSYEGTTFEI